MVLLVYLLVGAIAGLLAGLFGIGGGMIIVPALVLAFEAQQVSPEVLTHLAVGTSLATIVFTSMSSIRTHHQKGGVDWPAFKKISVGIVIGSALGVATADQLSGEHLQKIIGTFALCAAAQMAFQLSPKPSRQLPGSFGLGVVGSFIGWASAIFGIGGGTLSVPFLTWCNLKVQRAVGTAAAIGFPIAFIAAITNVVVGWDKAGLPEWTSGYVYWPAFFGIVVTSVFFARQGAKLAHRLPPLILKRTFACLLVVVGTRFLLS
ncbi:sulfite exporter TauE/SafE family protein [Litoribrevibacter euphylliae]|uniref:Probable membrane transporter protein n=1 Tax=Litoribrevibacter euphylliae TaxID=1834034 RepID=A0ABV7HJ27_9GAMM